MTILEMYEAKLEEAARAQVRAERAAAPIFTVLGARGFHVSDAQRRRIEACRDLEQLEQWLVLAVTAGSTDELFQA